MSTTASAITPAKQVAANGVIHAHPTYSKTAAVPTNRGYTELLVQQRDRICIITFNRPAVRNALTRRGSYELIRALSDANINDAITTIVITGAAGYFTAGTDLTQTQHFNDSQVNAYFRASNLVLHYLTKTFINCTKVLVALVDGPCIGIGFVIAALCDVVYCTERAYFQAPFVKLGICAEGAISYLLPQLMGRVKAAELLIFGTSLSAEDALRSNFVARLVSSELVERELWPQLALYSRLPEESLRATKRLLSKTERDNIHRALQAECLELGRLRVSAAHKRVLKEWRERIGSNRNSENKSKL